ncbi:MAG: carboxypeptidase regulatory-like domain-containing protein, partial [Candidatus Acidiferrales bacterium]
MIRRAYLRWLLASLLPCLLASASSAGTVTGTIRNGTTGKPAAGVDVILIQLQGTMQPVANTTTDSEGHYHFDNPVLGTAPMLIRAVYRGVNYHEPVPPGTTTADVEVFEPTDKPNAFSVTARAIILQPSG